MANKLRVVKKLGLALCAALITTIPAIFLFSEEAQNFLSATLPFIFNTLTDDSSRLLSKILSVMAIAALFVGLCFIFCREPSVSDEKLSIIVNQIVNQKLQELNRKPQNIILENTTAAAASDVAP